MDNADHIPTLARNAVFIADRRPVTTSQTIANTFGKRHREVLRAIRNLEAPADFNGRNFAPVEYTDAKGEQRPMYYITRDGFFMLAMGFTGKRAALFKVAFIRAFNALESEIQRQTPPPLWKLYDNPVLLNALRHAAPRVITEGLTRAEIIAALEMFGETPATVSRVIIAIREPGGKWHKYPPPRRNTERLQPPELLAGIIGEPKPADSKGGAK